MSLTAFLCHDRVQTQLLKASYRCTKGLAGGDVVTSTGI